MSFSHDLLLPISSIVEVYRFNLDVRMQSVLIEQDSTASIMCGSEVVRQELVLEALNCLLQCDDVPFLRDVFFDGTFFAASGSWIPVVDAEPLLLA